MNGFAAGHLYIAGGMAVLMTVGILVLAVVGQPIPQVLSSGWTLSVGWAFGGAAERRNGNGKEKRS